MIDPNALIMGVTLAIVALILAPLFVTQADQSDNVSQQSLFTLVVKFALAMTATVLYLIVSPLRALARLARSARDAVTKQLGQALEVATPSAYSTTAS